MQASSLSRREANLTFHTSQPPQPDLFWMMSKSCSMGQTPAGLAMSSPGTLPLGTRQWPSNQLTCRCLSRAAAGSALALACSKQRTPAGPGGWRRSQASQKRKLRARPKVSLARPMAWRGRAGGPPRRRWHLKARGRRPGGPAPASLSLSLSESRRAVSDFRPLSKPTRPIDDAAGHAGRRRWQ
jgi:hypothetical protein